MNSTLSRPDAGTAVLPVDDRSLRLPANCTTVTAEDFRIRLVMAADVVTTIEVDASAVENIGQAMLQLLVAARVEAEGNGQTFVIVDPSPAFVERVNRCGLAAAIGILAERDHRQ